MNGYLRNAIYVRNLAIVCLFTLHLNVGYAQQKEDSFSLKDCIQFMLKNYPGSTIYLNNVKIAKEKIRENNAAFLPSLSGNASMDYNIKLQTSVIPAGSFSPTETKLQMGNKFSAGAYLQADQAIFDKSALIDVKVARVDKEIADLNVLKENETLIYNTATAYYEVLTYGEKKKLLRESENQYKQLLEILKLRYEQGVVKKNEYDRTRVDLNNIQSELAVNDNNYHLSLNKLKKTIGLDLKTALTIDESIDYTTPQDISLLNGLDVRQLPDYLIDEKNLLQKEIDIQKKRAAYLPTVSLYAKYGANAYGAELSNTFNNLYDYSVVGLKVSVPIFSGFKKNSQLQQSRLNAENQRLTVKLNSSDYQLNYENSGSQLFSSYKSLKKNKDNLDLAKEVLDAAQIEYREGTSTLSSYLDADYSYKEAQSNYITSLLDFLNAQIALEKAKGTLASYVNHLK